MDDLETTEGVEATWESPVLFWGSRGKGREGEDLGEGVRHVTFVLFLFSVPFLFLFLFCSWGGRAEGLTHFLF